MLQVPLSERPTTGCENEPAAHTLGGGVGHSPACVVSLCVCSSYTSNNPTERR